MLIEKFIKGDEVAVFFETQKFIGLGIGVDNFDGIRNNCITFVFLFFSVGIYWYK
jgi:hypothetical protein